MAIRLRSSERYRATTLLPTRTSRIRRPRRSTIAAAAAVGNLLAHPAPPPPPPIGEEIRPLVDALLRDIAQETAGVDRFVGVAAVDLCRQLKHWYSTDYPRRG